MARVSWFSKASAIVACAAGLAASSVAHAQPAPAKVSDPLEPLNRGLYSIHNGLDKVLVRPLMVVYVTLLPEPLRSGVRNAVDNIGLPVTFVNDVLQGRPRAAGRTVGRFAVNSTVGVAGLFDVATGAGLPRHYADFGQTLGRYGVGPGPFLFIPVLGPSTFRDTAGRVADNYTDPVRWPRYEGRNALSITRGVVTGLELRATYDDELKALPNTATDPYVTLRSAYLQNRRNFIRGGEVDVDALPSFTPEEAPLPPPAAQPQPNVPTPPATTGPVSILPSHGAIRLAAAQHSFFRTP